MKASRAAVVVIAAVALAFSGSAFAKGGKGGRSAHRSGSHHHHHHHARSHVFVGAFATAPMWPSWAYGAYAEYAGPVHYIERGEAGEGEWLFCSATQNYFPHVMECAGGWQSVTPSPAPG